MKNALTFRRVIRAMFGVLALSILAGVSGRAESAKVAAGFMPVGAVDMGTTLRDAGVLASRVGGLVVRVEGRSMLPYFGDGSVLVVRTGGLENLRAGAVVVYRNHLGEKIAHRLESRVAEGWKVRGANNAASDTTLVTTENFIGSVYVTFHSDARSLSEAAGEMVAGLVSATPVVLAAEAR